MTREQLLAAIINAIQQDANLLIALRAVVTQNIANVDDDRLRMLANLLGISS